MIRKIARKEFIELLRDGRFRITAAIVFALLLVSLAIGFNQYREARADRAAAQATAYEQWLNQGERNPHSAAHYGMYAFKPLSALAFVDRGTENYTGTAIFLEAHKRNEFRFRPAKDTASVARFGELTAAIVLQLLLPLLIILLTFSTFSGERESGTLRQVLSLGAARRDLAIGKALGAAVALGVLLVPAILPAVVLLSLVSTDTSWQNELARGAFLTTFYLVYFAVILLVALAVSARARSSRAALVILLAFWIFTGLVVPRASADLAKRLYPTPSTVQFSREMEKEILHAEQGRKERLTAKVLKEYNVQRIEDLPFNFEGLSLQDSEERGDEVIDRFYQNLETTFERQNRLQEIAAAFSPAQAARLVSMGLSGTDIATQRDFARASEDYRRIFVREMNEAVMRDEGVFDQNYRGTQTLSRKAGRELWETVEPFSYEMPSVFWVLRNHVFGIGVLLGWLAIALVFAWRSIAVLKVD